MSNIPVFALAQVAIGNFFAFIISASDISNGLYMICLILSVGLNITGMMSLILTPFLTRLSQKKSFSEKC